MASKRLTVGSAIALFVSAFGLLFRESVGWIVGKILDHLPLPKSASGVVNWAAIPWLNMLAFGLLALGVFLFYRGGKMQVATIVAPNPYSALSARAYRVAGEISGYRNTRGLYRNRLPDLVPIVREGTSLLISFEKAGFPVPRLTSSDAAKVAVGLEHYFGSIAPLLKDGHSDVAINGAQTISNTADDLSESLQMDKWWTASDW